MAKSFQRFPRGILPLLPIAPVIVVAVGVSIAAAIAVLGIAQLRVTSDEDASLRADALAAALAARLRTTAIEDRPELLGRAARRSAAELMLVQQDGQIVVNETFGKPSRDEVVRLLVTGKGETRTALGRVRYAARPLSQPLGHLSLVTFVAAPNPPPGSIPLVNAVLALTALLLGIAVGVSVAYAKAARDDVAYVRRRIVDMAGPDADPAGEQVPIRSLDQVGALTAAFNLLVARFTAAERSYRADLAQAKEGARERSAFLAGLSHELRTPLNAILGFSHVLESEVDGPLGPDAREALGVIRKSGEHLKTLIDDVLELSALETGQLKLSRRAVDVRDVADEVAREARATVRDKPVELLVKTKDGLVAHADPRRVRQILTNLVANAIKATARGSVTVGADARGAFIALWVADTGAGIAPDELPTIFEAYRQAGDVKTRRGGAGLGLSIAERLVKMHGGTIDVESRLGKGSIFTVCLPRYNEDADMSDLSWSRPDYMSPLGTGSRPSSAPTTGGPTTTGPATGRPRA